LWGVANVVDAEASAVMLQERGSMRVACLADGSAWALVQPEQLACLQARTEYLVLSRFVQTSRLQRLADACCDGSVVRWAGSCARHCTLHSGAWATASSQKQAHQSSHCQP